MLWPAQLWASALGAGALPAGTLMHSTRSGEGQRVRHRGHRALLDQALGISTAGASSSSTGPSDVSTATRTAVLFVSTLTFPGGKWRTGDVSHTASGSDQPLASAGVTFMVPVAHHGGGAVGRRGGEALTSKLDNQPGK